MPCFLIIPRSSCNENITFVIGSKRQFLYPRHSFFVQTDIHFCPEFHWRGCLPADNRTDVRLADTDDPVRDRVDFVLIHVPLLFIDFIDYSKLPGLLWSQFTSRIQQPVNVASIPADILELLFDCLSDLLTGTFFTLCQIQVISSGIPAIHPGNVIVKSPAQVASRINVPVFSPVSVPVVSGLLPPPGGGSSGVLYERIISLISPRTSSVRRFRKSTRSDGTKGGSVWYPGSPIKYWKYGFPMSSSTSSLSERPSCFWIRREPSAIRSGFPYSFLSPLAD